jgi:hypothetical protein
MFSSTPSSSPEAAVSSASSRSQTGSAGGRSSGGGTHATNPEIEELKTRIKLLEAMLGALSGQLGSSDSASNQDNRGGVSASTGRSDNSGSARNIGAAGSRSGIPNPATSLTKVGMIMQIEAEIGAAQAALVQLKLANNQTTGLVSKSG